MATDQTLPAGPTTGKTLADIAEALNRPVIVITSLQHRFELPSFGGTGYSEAYLAFLHTVVHLRTLGIAEDRLLRLWHLEKKLLQLLNADTTSSKTWFLDSCGPTTRRKQRLLLTNYDIGLPVPSHELQLGLSFSEKLPELFGGKEMGEDALRVLNDYISSYGRIRSDIAAELPHLRETATWATRIP